MTERPILYLDVDGVLLRHPDRNQFANEREFRDWWAKNPRGGAPLGVEGFLTWARSEFDCRWLTAWTCCGQMPDDMVCELAGYIGVNPDLLRGMDNPLPWHESKTEGIDWAAHERGVEWYWLDDDARRMEREVRGLDEHRAYNRLIDCDTSKNADSLSYAQEFIERRHTNSEQDGSNE
jgi:hypothetical protein